MRRTALAALAVAALVLAPAAGAVAAGAAAAPEFERSVYSADRGETAEVTVDATGVGDGVRFALGDADDSNFEVRAAVTDADGDGSVTVRFDSGAVQGADPATYPTVAQGDAVADRTEVAGVDDPLDPASYDLALGDPGAPTDEGSLALLSADDTPTDGGTHKPTHNGTTLDTTDGEVVVSPAPDQTVSGETTLDPGTAVSIRVQSTSTDSPFLMTVETTVADDGTFAGTFDFGDLSSGTAFRVSVRGDGDDLARATGRVADCEGDCPTATATPGETTTLTPLDAGEVAVRSVVRVDRGGVAELPVAFGEADALTVVVGDEQAVNYETSAVVRDTDGDGRAVVLFRTNATDDADRPALAVRESGETRPVNVTAETTLDSPVDPASYSVDVFRGPGVGGDPDDSGTLAVVASDGDGSSSDERRAGPPDGTDDDPLVAGAGALVAGVVVVFGGIALFAGLVRG